MSKLAVKHLLALFAMATLFASCASTVNIPNTLSPAELIQRAQEASDRNRYKIALQYYEALLERNSGNPEMVCTAEYEIGFIHYKQKKYAEARNELNALLERYKEQDAELLPPQFKRLAEIVLDSITEKETPRFPFTLFQKKAAS